VQTMTVTKRRSCFAISSIAGANYPCNKKPAKSGFFGSQSLKDYATSYLAI
jgi:hypothetical protein